MRISFIHRHLALHATLFIAGACGMFAGSAAAQSTRGATATAEDSARALHLLSRATFGARPADIGAVLAIGRDAWLERQLHPESIRDTLGPLLDKRYPAG